MLQGAPISYPIFQNFYGKPDIDNEQDKLLLTIFLYCYYTKLYYLCQAGSSEIVKEMKIILKSRISVEKFANKHIERLFVDILNRDSFNMGVLSSYFIGSSFKEGDRRRQFILSYCKMFVQDYEITSNPYSEEKYTVVLPIFYTNLSQVSYRFEDLQVTNYLPNQASVNPGSALSFNLILPGLSLAQNMEEALHFLSTFHVEPFSIKSNFTQFTIYDIARQLLICKDISYLTISSIRHLSCYIEVLNKLSFISNVGEKFIEVINNISNSDINNNNNMSRKYLTLEDIVEVIGTEADKGESEDEPDEPVEDDDKGESEDEPVEDDEDEDKPNDTSGYDPDKEKKKAVRYIGYKISTNTSNERLEDFMLKVAFFNKIFTLIHQTETAKEASFKIAILKEWIAKWIFVTPLFETTKLIKELKLKHLK